MNKKSKVYIAIMEVAYESKDILSAHKSREGAYEVIQRDAVRVGNDRVKVTKDGFEYGELSWYIEETEYMP